MTQTFSISALRREGTGKGPARSARRAGRIPGVIYGGGQDPVSVSVERKAFRVAMAQTGFLNSVIGLELDGGTQKVLARDVQLDPVTDVPLHVDFLRVSAATRISVEVPVAFLNEEASPGIKRGGMLNVVRHSIEVECNVDAMPASFSVDLTGLDIGGSVHISQIEMPAGVTPTISDRDFTIATVAAPSAVRAEAAAETAAAEEGEEEEGAE